MKRLFVNLEKKTEEASEQKIDHISSLPVDIWSVIIDLLWHMLVRYVRCQGINELMERNGKELLFYRKKPLATLSMSMYLRKKLFYGAGLVRFGLFDMLYLRPVEVTKWSFFNRVLLPPSLFFFRPLDRETRALLNNKRFYQTFAKATTRGMKTLYEALDRHRTVINAASCPGYKWMLETEWTDACSCLYCKEVLRFHLDLDDEDFYDYYEEEDDEEDRLAFYMNPRLGYH